MAGKRKKQRKPTAPAPDPLEVWIRLGGEAPESAEPDEGEDTVEAQIRRGNELVRSFQFQGIPRSGFFR